MTPICKHVLIFAEGKALGKRQKSPPTHPIPPVPDFLHRLRADLNAFSKKHGVHSRPHLWHGLVQEQVRHLQGREAQQVLGHNR